MNCRLLLLLFVALVTLCQISCSSHAIKDGPPLHYVDVSDIPNATPKAEPKCVYGNPKSYVVNGKRYHVLSSAKGYSQRGIASWYGTKFHGKLTSSREPYDMLGMTAASPVLPIPTYVRVTNLRNGRSIVVKVNDRGPFAPHRILDLTYVGAKKLGYIRQGTAPVLVTAIDPSKPINDIRQPSSPDASPNASFNTSSTVSANAPDFSDTEIVDRTQRVYVQAASFSSQQAAKRWIKTLSFLDDPVTASKTVNKAEQKVYYRVMIGPLASADDADEIIEALHQHQIHDAIIRIH